MTTALVPRNEGQLERYIAEVSQYPLLSREEEQELARAFRDENDIGAAHKLVVSNLRFVVTVAKQYVGQGLTLQDLINEGNIGLMKAARRFDEKRGFKFISYAVWWIRQAILNALKRTSTVVMPANRQEDMDRMARRWGQMTQELGRIPTLDEVASDMKISPPRMRAQTDPAWLPRRRSATRSSRARGTRRTKSRMG